MEKILFCLFMFFITTNTAHSWEVYRQGEGNNPAVVVSDQEGGSCLASWVARGPDGNDYQVGVGLNAGHDALLFNFTMVGIPPFPKDS